MHSKMRMAVRAVAAVAILSSHASASRSMVETDRLTYICADVECGDWIGADLACWSAMGLNYHATEMNCGGCPANNRINCQFY